MLWLIESCQKGYLLTSVTNKQKQGGKVKKKTNKQTNKQTGEEGEKYKGAGVSLTDYKPKSYLEIYYVYMPQPYGHGSQLLNNNLQCI